DIESVRGRDTYPHAAGAQGRRAADLGGDRGEREHQPRGHPPHDGRTARGASGCFAAGCWRRLAARRRARGDHPLRCLPRCRDRRSPGSPAEVAECLLPGRADDLRHTRRGFPRGRDGDGRAPGARDDRRCAARRGAAVEFSTI
ncbi:MAG: Rrf2 family transcriptional regulator, group III, partial [uncultured Thermomicrobiales bacterium]